MGRLAHMRKVSELGKSLLGTPDTPVEPEQQPSSESEEELSSQGAEDGGSE
jgi:hypothetical protein